MCKDMCKKKKTEKEIKRINKKGSTHVDWVMSIGIFLVYLISVFIVIKPGVKEIHEGNILLYIVENNFKKNVTWTIKEVPLIMKSNCVKHDETTPQIRVELSDSDWKFSKVEPIPEEEYSLSDYSFLLWDDSIIKKRNYSLTYYPIKQNPSKPNLRLVFRPNPPYCDVELGVVEDMEGLAKRWLNNLKNQDYEEVKTNWGYPESKDFSIYINTTEVEDLFGFSFNPVEPEQQADVFVKEWKTYIVDNDGNKSKVKINVRVW